MKFRFLLWAFGLLMIRAGKKNQKFRDKITDKNVVFQFETKDQEVVRHFIIKDQAVVSNSGSYADPGFTFAFDNAGYGFGVLTAAAKDPSVFMKGIQEQKIKFSGDSSTLMWFVSIAKYIRP